MINTFNESALHKTLKTFYSVRENASEEVAVGRWICDLITPAGDVIEIQNKNVSALAEKIASLLESRRADRKRRRVTVVHPIVREKIIELYSKEGELLSRRKSPKKESVYSMLRELTGLAAARVRGAPLLLAPNFTLLCPDISVTEKRVKCASPAQAKNGRRRFLKDWNKAGKALLTIGAETKFSGAKDYLALLPSGLLNESCSNYSNEFSSKELRALFLAQKNKSGAAAANLLLWILHKMELIERVSPEQVPHAGRAYYYRIKE